MSGKVTVPDAKTVGYYLDKTSEKSENIEIPTDLNTVDLYKNFRLKGFEYGPPFQLLMAGNLEGRSRKQFQKHRTSKELAVITINFK